MTRVVLATHWVTMYPRAGGHFWVFLQYADALRRVGCDVWWLEELPTGLDPAQERARVAELIGRLRPHRLGDHLIAYRRSDRAGGAPSYLNLPRAQAERVLGGAELLLNFHYALPAEVHGRFRRTALVDIDPGLLQLWWREGSLDVQPHDSYFSIGENLREVPGHRTACWVHTPPAVSLDLWPVRYDPGPAPFTTVTSWYSRSYVTIDGETVDTNKRVSYLRHVELPRHTRTRLELATVLSSEDETDRRLLASRGWSVRDAVQVAGDPESYQAYVQGSRGEFACAKPAYVLLGNAWISDRTVCYLASGKPAVVQDTGPSAYLPSGSGLLRFSTPEEAVAGLAEVEAHYERHCRAARELAESCFAARPVVTRMLQQALR